MNALKMNVTVLAALMCVSGALAQDAEEPIEEVTAYGQKTLLNLKYAALQAETDFFSRFNELNEIDEFDVYCDKTGSTYSRVKRRRCWSPFEREFDQDQAEYAFSTGGRVGGRNEALVQLKRKKQAEHLKNMVLENPELQALYRRLGEANIEFETERQRRCSGDIFCRDKETEESSDEAPESEQ
jgi:hypothetical protein